MTYSGDADLIDWEAFAEARSMLGVDFVRILGYFREDGMKSVAKLEEAMRSHNSVGMVMPAHTLKGEAYQFGAAKLADVAEQIEIAARHYVEIHQDPSDIVDKIAQLRPLFEATLATLEAEVSPLIERRAVGGSRNPFGGSVYGKFA